MHCDVCVVGSGAGGGVAAAVLAQSGLDVVVLEAGPAVSEADFVGDELDAYRRFYWGAAAGTTDDGGIGLLTGECLGGTTTASRRLSGLMVCGRPRGGRRSLRGRSPRHGHLS